MLKSSTTWKQDQHFTMSKQFVEEAGENLKRDKFGRIIREDQDEILAVRKQKVF